MANADFIDSLPSGARVFVQGACNEPQTLIELLQDHAERLPQGLNFMQFPIGGFNRTDFTALSASTQQSTFFMTADLRDAAPDRLHFLPMQMRWINDFVRRHTDVALIQVAHDRNGQLRLGPNVDFTQAALGCARLVVAELNEALVAPLGAPPIDAQQIHHLIPSNRALYVPPAAAVDETAARIGGLVAELIDDGACLQTGIGAIPAAILAALGDKQDLGWHGGLIDDGVLGLIEQGVLTGARKPVDAGLHIAGMVLGSPALHAAAAQQGNILLRGADYTHDVGAIGQQPNFVSINSAVQVDLQGQINAEVVGGRQISGTGGSVDFMRGAKASQGGRSIVALTATARGGSVSRIVPKVEMVTALRTDVDTVVTEYGVAQLDGLSLPQRAAALIGIAAPQFRDELAASVN